MTPQKSALKIGKTRSSVQTADRRYMDRSARTALQDQINNAMAKSRQHNHNLQIYDSRAASKSGRRAYGSKVSTFDARHV